MPDSPVSTSKDPTRISEMFDAIARRYDTLNHLLSAGLDRRWRRRTVRALALGPDDRVVDVCTGTGDLAIEAAGGASGRPREIVGIDFAGEMLRYAAVKVRAARLESPVRLVRGDAMRLPLPDASREAAMIAFGIRNVAEPEAACREFCRVLGPRGRLAVAEFAAPNSPVLKKLYRAYFRHVLPRIGGFVSRHKEAYSYLPASVDEFPPPPEFAAMLRRAGFSAVEYRPMTFGIAYLYLATK